ncbi:MAG: hypothetical protein ACOVOV_11560, partial [Dolichospermum sp.]
MQIAGSSASGSSSTSLFTNLVNLTGNTTYFYTITATNSAGSVTSSPVSSFTTIAGPVISAISPSNITQNGATINFSVNPNNINSQAFVRYGTNVNSITANTAQTGAIFGTGTTAITRNLTGLNAGTQYFYQVIAFSVLGDTTFSPIQNFTTTSAPVPVLSNVSSTNVTFNAATINYTVNANGNNASSAVRYGTAANSLSSVIFGNGATGSSNTTLNVTITSLSASTKYYYRVEATNTGGTATAAIDSFTTAPAASLPTATNLNHINVNATGATITYTVNTNGASTQSIVYIGSSSSSFNVGSSNFITSATSGNVSQTVNGLNRNTTYFYRVTVSNAAGQQNSTVGTFTTTDGPSIQFVQFIPGATMFQANPLINPNGSATTTVVKYGLSETSLSSSVTGPTITGNSFVSSSTIVTGLTPSTTYYFIVEATNSNGTAQSIV